MVCIPASCRWLVCFLASFFNSQHPQHPNSHAIPSNEILKASSQHPIHTHTHTRARARAQPGLCTNDPTTIADSDVTSELLAAKLLNVSLFAGARRSLHPDDDTDDSGGDGESDAVA